MEFIVHSDKPSLMKSLWLGQKSNLILPLWFFMCVFEPSRERERGLGTKITYLLIAGLCLIDFASARVWKNCLQKMFVRHINISWRLSEHVEWNLISPQGMLLTISEDNLQGHSRFGSFMRFIRAQLRCHLMDNVSVILDIVHPHGRTHGKVPRNRQIVRNDCN